MFLIRPILGSYQQILDQEMKGHVYCYFLPLHDICYHAEVLEVKRWVGKSPQVLSAFKALPLLFMWGNNSSVTDFDN